jgi:ketosteroid isomerase-like protein
LLIGVAAAFTRKQKRPSSHSSQSGDTAWAVSQENVDLAYRAYAAFRAGDLDEWVSYFDPEVEFSWTELEGHFRGHEGVREWAASLVAAFPDWKPSIVEIRDLGDLALIHGRGGGEGARSGLGIEVDFWQAVEVRGGRVVWSAAFRTEADALEAVRLRE